MARAASPRANNRWRFFGFLGQLRMAYHACSAVAYTDNPLVTDERRAEAAALADRISTLMHALSTDYHLKPKNER